jgi:hypothetical protein
MLKNWFAALFTFALLAALAGLGCTGGGETVVSGFGNSAT